MRRIIPLAFGLALWCASTSPALASSFIIDTGPSFGAGCGFCLVDPYHRLSAVGFSLGQDYEITSIESIFWYNGTIGTSSNVTISIIGDTSVGQPWADQGWDGSTFPIGPLYSGTFSVPASSGFSGWQGLTGLNWALEAGAYWAVFSGGAGGTAQSGALDPVLTAGLSSLWGHGRIVNVESDSPSNFYNFDWFGLAEGNHALRVGAEELQAVPEPSTLLLVAGGGIAAIRRLRRGLLGTAHLSSARVADTPARAPCRPRP